MGRMRKWVAWACVGVGFAMAGGCGDGEKEAPKPAPREALPPGHHVTGEDSLLTNLPPEAVIVFVNGDAMTRRQFDATLSMYEKLSQMRRPSRSPEDNQRLSQGRAQRILPEFTRRALLRQEAARLGIEPSEEDIQTVSVRTVSSLNRKGETLEAVAKELGGDAGAVFCDIVNGDARDLALRRVVAAEALTVTEEALDAEMAIIARYNALVVATNAFNQAKAAQIVEELRAGRDFAEAAKEYGEVSPEHGEGWCADCLEDIDTPEIVVWLKKAAEGDISDPIEMDDGLSVVKLVKILPAEDDFDVTRYAMSRITLYIFEAQYENATREEMREEMISVQVKRVYEELVTRLYREAAFEYPHGTNLFPVVSRPQIRRSVPAVNGPTPGVGR